MTAVFYTINLVLDLYKYVLIASAIMSWLYAFNVINSNNQFVNSVGVFLYNVTDPLLRPIRRLLPNLGGIDISPIVLFVVIIFLQVLLRTSIAPLFGVLYY